MHQRCQRRPVPAPFPVGRRSLSILAAVLLVACQSAVDSEARRLQIRVSTAGVDFDADGYRYRLTGPSVREGRIEANGTVEVEGLPEGDYAVELGDISPNCSPVDGARRSLNVRWRMEAAFAVSCAPNVGSVRIVVSTVGPDPDPDGFEITMDEGSPRRIPAEGTVLLERIPAGEHLLTVGDVAPNCSLSGDDSRSLLVAFGEEAEVELRVECLPATVDLTVRATTAGEDPDVDGYRAVLDGTDAASLPAEGAVVFPAVPAGEHTVELTELADNCRVEGTNPRTLSVAYGEEERILAFDVICSAGADGSAGEGDDSGTTADDGGTTRDDGGATGGDEAGGETGGDDRGDDRGDDGERGDDGGSDDGGERDEREPGGCTWGSWTGRA